MIGSPSKKAVIQLDQLWLCHLKMVMSYSLCILVPSRCAITAIDPIFLRGRGGPSGQQWIVKHYYKK